MGPRTNYEMSDDDLQALLAAMKPVPCIMFGGYAPPSPQENANAAWKALGEKMGFDHMTAQPIAGKGQRFFSAVPSETEEARAERVEREAVQARILEASALRSQIAALKDKLAALEGRTP